MGKYVEQDMLRIGLIFSGDHVADEEHAVFRLEREQGCICISRLTWLPLTGIVNHTSLLWCIFRASSHLTVIE